jgi:hypothetical protein
MGALASDLFNLVLAYAKQETIDPLRALKRFVVWGVAGAVLLAAGAALVDLALIRLLQSETGSHLAGNLTWVPYAAGTLFAGLVAALALSRIGKGTP